MSEALAGNDSAENAGKPLKREPAPGTKPKTDDHLETNEIPQDQGMQDKHYGKNIIQGFIIFAYLNDK